MITSNPQSHHLSNSGQGTLTSLHWTRQVSQVSHHFFRSLYTNQRPSSRADSQFRTQLGSADSIVILAGEQDRALGDKILVLVLADWVE